MAKKRKAPEGYGDAPKRFNDHKRPKRNDRVADYASKKTPELGRSKKRSLVFTPRPDWHATDFANLPLVDNPVLPPQATVDALKEHADHLLEEENSLYNATVLSKSSSHKFMSTIMSSGTMEDRVSALTLVVQESPLHTMKAFDALIGLAKKKSRNQALLALTALKDLLGQGVVLPPERKLRAFGRQPALLSALQGSSADWRKGDPLPGGIKDVHLILWAYEDWLKHTYFEVLKILELWCNDEVDFAQSRSITFVYELLKEKPEQEENLLRLLINKLGDQDKKVSSKASYLLLQLQLTHPMMKEIIINAIESELLFKPGQRLHAKYYATVTLNQTVLSTREERVANKLMDLYFRLFLTLLKHKEPDTQKDARKAGKQQGGGGKPGKMAKQKAVKIEGAAKPQEELEERMIAQLLSGVNRAFPYSNTDDKTFEAHLDTIFRVTHSSNFNTSIQALMLIQQISAAKQYAAERYYRTLYESLLDPRLLTSSKQVLYLNLLYRSIKSDISVKRVKAFVKRLLQIITLHEPPFVCGVIYLIHELKSTIPSIEAMLDQPERNIDDDEEHFVDVGEDGRASNEIHNAHNERKQSAAYDPRKQNPEYCNADLSCLWELIPFQIHFHPTVASYATRLLASQKMQDKPDPTLHTLMHFLDRFVYKNAKVKPSTRGFSIMQPLAGAPDVDMLIKDRTGGREELPLNVESFWQMKKDQVAVDEVFFHQYFAQMGKKKSRQEMRAAAGAKGEDGSEDSEEEREIWKALIGSRPNIEGDEEDEDDMDLADYISAGEESEEVLDGGVEIHDAPDSEEGDEGKTDEELVEASDDGFDAAALESDDALLGSDDEVLAQDVPFEGFDDRSDEAKRKSTEKKSDKKKQRKTLKSLPVFASAEDYAKLMGDKEDDGIY